MDPNLSNEKTNSDDNQQDLSNLICFSRRRFYKYIAMITAANTAVVCSIPYFASPDQLKEVSNELGSKVPLSLKAEALRDSKPCTKTVIETVLMWAAMKTTNHITRPILERHGYESGSQSHRFDDVPETRRQMLGRYFHQNFLMPVVEEALFRLVPSSLLSAKEPIKMHWEVGLPITAVFAYIHNIGKLENGDFFIHKKSIPLPQIILGLYCWHAQRTGGFKHAAIAHVLYNHLCSISVNEILASKTHKDLPKE